MISALAERIDAWREPAWPFRRWRDNPPKYRWFTILFAPLAAGAVLAAAQVFDAPVLAGDLGVVLIATAIMAGPSLQVFRADETSTIDPVTAVAATMVFVGQPAAGLVGIVVSMLITPLRKPLRWHLIWLNVWGPGLFSFLAMALVYTEVIGGAEVGSLRWVLAAAISYLTLSLCEFVSVQGAMILGRYAPGHTALRDLIATAREGLVSMAPLAAVLAIVVAAGPRWHLVFLFVPLLVTHQIFSKHDALVDARRAADRDPLTGLSNRRTLERELQRRASAPRGDTPQWIIVIDLDHFKRLNDTRGHDVGDEALKAAARCIEASVRDVDLAARYGGEEFVVLFEAVDVTSVGDIGERLRAAIELELAQFETTASIGASRIGRDPALAFQHADAAMYESKTSGRNRVTIDEARSSAVRSIS